MEQEIIYTKNRHWYARIKDWKLVIAIPSILRYNTRFKNQLIAQWQKLAEKHQKLNHIQIQDEDSILIFGERVSKSELNIKITKDQSERVYQTKLNNAIKDILLEYITPLVDEFSQKLWFKYSKISVRKAKSKRGSCSWDQKLMFNINLLHLSTKYVRYVVIHEICHLKHKNHSKKFRAEVEWFMPEYKEIRKEMKKMIVE